MKDLAENISAFSHRQRMLKPDLEIYHYREPYGKTLDFHSHDFYEIYVFLDGNVSYYIEEKVFILVSGDVMVIPPGKMHRPVITDLDSVYERIVVWVSPAYVRTLSQYGILLDRLLAMEHEKKYIVHFKRDEFTEILRLLSRLLTEHTAQTYGSHEMQGAILTELFVLMVRQALAQKRTSHQEDKGIVPGVIRYINDHLSEELTLDGLSELFFISKYHLIREFRRYTNTTVYDYIIAKRIITAKKHMSEGMTATEACQMCGFTDYSNFYKSFIKKTGMTPKAFKQQKW